MICCYFAAAAGGAGADGGSGGLVFNACFAVFVSVFLFFLNQ